MNLYELGPDDEDDDEFEEGEELGDDEDLEDEDDTCADCGNPVDDCSCFSEDDDGEGDEE